MQSQCSGLTLRNNGAQVLGGQGAQSAVKSHRPHKHTGRMESFCRNHEPVCPPYRNVECRPVRVMPFPVIGDCRVFPPWRSSIERLQGLDLSITASGLFSTESPSNLSHGEYKTNNTSEKQHSKYLRTIINWVKTSSLFCFIIYVFSPKIPKISYLTVIMDFCEML